MAKRRKIAVFSSSIYEPMVRTMLNGVIRAAEETGDKVICFTSFSNAYSSNYYDKLYLYDEGDVVAIELPDLSDFDGIIKVEQAMNKHAHDRLMERIRATELPVINVGCHEEELINILNDEETSFSEVVEHVITVHGCRDICHLAGPKEMSFVEERIEVYKKTLLKHDIEFDPDKVYYGTLWKDCGEAALDYFIEQSAKRGKKFPDAIICANDYSAMGLINACRDRGINVPGDIIITGYDGVEEAYQGYPSITTSEQPFYQSGYDSVYALHRIWDGEKITDNIRIRGKLMCNQSCGCEPLTANAVDDIRRLFQEKLDSTSYLSLSMINLSLMVSGADTIEDCFREITETAKVDTGFKDMLLCLSHDWNKMKTVDTHFHETDEEMTVVAGFIDGEPVPRQTFRRKDILPKDLMDAAKPYFIFPIHHLQYYMGYLIVSPEENVCDKLTMLAWILNLGIMLDNWRVRQELSSAVSHMENLYNRDMLTNLYNNAKTEAAKEYLSLLGNRVLCSKLYLDCIHDGLALKEVPHQKNNPVAPTDRKKVNQICEKCIAGYERMLRILAQQMPDRGCLGTIVSIWNGPVFGMMTQNHKLTGAPLDAPVNNEISLDTPPLPTFVK